MKISLRNIFVLSLLFNIFCASGHDDSIDAGVSVITAKAVLERGTTEIPYQNPPGYTVLAKGKEGFYSSSGSLTSSFICPWSS